MTTTPLHFSQAYMVLAPWLINTNKNDSNENMEETTTNENRITIKSITGWYQVMEW